MLIEQLQYNLLFRWFVGLNMDEPVGVPTVFSKNRERLMEGDVAQKFFAQVLSQASAGGLVSDEHFGVDGTLIEAWVFDTSISGWAGRTLGSGGGPWGGRGFTHESKTDPEARLARKGGGHESKLAYCGNLLMENRNGLVVDTELLQSAAPPSATRLAHDGRTH